MKNNETFKSWTFNLNAAFLEWCVMHKMLQKMQNVSAVVKHVRLAYLHKKTMEK